jgi:hypothetical protein
MKLFRFFWDVGRMGEIEGLFVAEQSEVDRIIGKELYLGEVLGKHSEIYGTVEANEITVVSEDEDVCKHLIDECKSKTICGYNPIDSWEEGSCGECGEYNTECVCEEEE